MLYNADCLEKLKELPENSVDSIVTDPPAGISFMGREWDDDKGGKKQWIAWLSEVFIEAKRVLKPGGHALVWSLPRTSHWTATALEDAGYEVRDCVYHVFGSGFPKSLNIGKAVDKIQGNKREVVGEIRAGKTAMGQDSGWNAHENKTVMDLTKGSSEWEGWGTALKPAVECWWLVRKPLSEKTVAENVLKHGTGGLNIDGSRVESKPRKTGTRPTSDEATGSGNSVVGSSKNRQAEYDQEDNGRFPAHLIHDGSEEVLAGFPNTKSGKMKQHIEGGKFNVWAKQYPRDVETIGDQGSAARFFYCAKPSKAERDRGCEGMEKKQYSHDGREKAIENAFQRNDSVARNHHPTVKAQALMQYLIKLITPPKGVVLDMFMGSGSTGVAAKTLGFDFIGIEKEEEYFKIAEARIKAVNTLL